MAANRNYERATAAQLKFWELTDQFPEELQELWNAAAVGIGRGRAVELLEATMNYLRDEYLDGGVPVSRPYRKNTWQEKDFNG